MLGHVCHALMFRNWMYVGRCLRLRIGTEASTVMQLAEWCAPSTAPTTASK